MKMEPIKTTMGLPKTNWRMGLLVDEVDMCYVLCVCIQDPTAMDHLSNFFIPSYDSTQEAKMAFLFLFVFSHGGHAFLVVHSAEFELGWSGGCLSAW